MTPATRQRQCTLPRGHDSLHWFYGLELSKEVQGQRVRQQAMLNED